MMRSVKVALLLVLVPSLALAEERTAAVSVGAMAGGIERSYHELGDPEGVWGPRITLGFEHKPLPYPAQRGYRFDGAIVPELFGGGFVEPERAHLFFGAGVRTELRIAQREMGLLEVSARGAVYLAIRGMVLGDERKAFAEFGLGQYWVFSNGMRLGFEASLIAGRDDEVMDVDGIHDETNAGGVVQLYVGFGPR